MPRIASALALMAALATPAAAFDFEEPDPADRVKSSFTPQAFSRLGQRGLYDVSLALKRGRTITIIGCTASQSRAVFESSIAQKAPDMAALRNTCGG